MADLNEMIKERNYIVIEDGTLYGPYDTREEAEQKCCDLGVPPDGRVFEGRRVLDA
jgi:hypothetical protein